MRSDYQKFTELFQELDISVEENKELRGYDGVENYYNLGGGYAAIGFDESGKKVYFHGGYE